MESDKGFIGGRRSAVAKTRSGSNSRTSGPPNSLGSIPDTRVTVHFIPGTSVTLSDRRDSRERTSRPISVVLCGDSRHDVSGQSFPAPQRSRLHAPIAGLAESIARGDERPPCRRRHGLGGRPIKRHQNRGSFTARGRRARRTRRGCRRGRSRTRIVRTVVEWAWRRR
jgi:hypothetical protein